MRNSISIYSLRLFLAKQQSEVSLYMIQDNILISGPLIIQVLVLERSLCSVC